MAEGPNSGPEKSSFDKMKDLGLEEAKKLQSSQPEWRQNPPDIRMQLDEEAEAAQKGVEAYLESLRRDVGSERYETGNSLESLLRRSPDPDAMLSATRRIALGFEAEDTGGEMPNDYVVGRYVDTLMDRGTVLEVPLETLIKEGWVKTPSKEQRALLKGELEQGKGEVSRMKIENFGVPAVGGLGGQEFPVAESEVDTYELDTDGVTKKNVRYREKISTFSYFDDNARKEFSGRTKEMKEEILTRHVLHKDWGNYNFNRENLSGLVKLYFGPVPTAEGIDRLFNLRGRKGGPEKTVTGVEYTKGKEFGEMLDTAMRLYYVVGLSEKPNALKKLMESPGWKDFLFGPNVSTEIVKEWIGVPEEWASEITLEEMKAILNDPNTKDRSLNGKRNNKSLKEEIKNGHRGRLTQKNIFAESDQDIKDKLEKSIREFIAGERYEDDPIRREEAIAAQKLAYKAMKLWIFADELGWEAYDDRKNIASYDKNDPLKGVAISFENGPAASDFGKLTHPWLYMLKSYRKGRDYGPASSFNNGYDNLLVSVFSQISTEVEIPGKDKMEKRTLQEQWWGLPAEKIKVYKMDGEKIVFDETNYPQEPARRAGDFGWGFDRAIHTEALSTVYLSAFMAGREDGAYPLITKTDLSERDLTDYGFWRKFWKLLDVGIKDSTVLRGKLRGYPDNKVRADLVRKHKVRIIENFLRGMQSIPQWGTWEQQQVSYYNPKTGLRLSRTIGQRIIEVAEEALAIYGVKPKRLDSKELFPKK